MGKAGNKTIQYQGFEQGPIRPPAEANSLLLRLTRNCPWNRCTFCPLYKNERFSVRPISHVMQDIDMIHSYINDIQEACGDSNQISELSIQRVAQTVAPNDGLAFNAAAHWYLAGMHSIFFQDANCLIMKPADLIEILGYIKARFPKVQRITSFARTHTIARISDQDLKKMADQGLSRIHAGFETGSNKILAMVNKGCTKEMHIKAGAKIKKAGIELSECVLCGLGGKKLYQEHALETADAINRINPDIIRFLTLAVPAGAALYKNHPQEAYVRSTDVDIAIEIKLLLENLNGVTSYIESNNILNLLQEVEGTMPHDRQKMLNALDSFVGLPPEIRTLFQVGKRMQIFSSLSDLNDTDRMNIARQACAKYGVTPDNADEIIAEIIQRYM